MNEHEREKQSPTYRWRNSITIITTIIIIITAIGAGDLWSWYHRGGIVTTTTTTTITTITAITAIDAGAVIPTKRGFRPTPRRRLGGEPQSYPGRG
jgi:hypothetical protein